MRWRVSALEIRPDFCQFYHPVRVICRLFSLTRPQQRLDEEIQQLLVDIRRIGDEPGSPHVTFGELFDDDEAQQYYEALVGTLKSAKKRGVIDFKGQMLLKGVHDKVVIKITDAGLQDVPKMVEEPGKN